MSIGYSDKCRPHTEFNDTDKLHISQTFSGEILENNRIRANIQKDYNGIIDLVQFLFGVFFFDKLVLLAL